MAFSFRPGIRTEIVFTLTVLMAGSVALVGMLFLKVEERNLLEQRVRAGKQIAGALQKFLQEENGKGSAVFHGQSPSESLQRVLALFAETSAPFSHFSVVDGQCQILADSRPENVGKTLRMRGCGRPWRPAGFLPTAPTMASPFR